MQGEKTLNQKELVKCFKENICPYCKGNCKEGIIFTEDGARCVDYERKEPSKRCRPSILFWQQW